MYGVHNPDSRHTLSSATRLLLRYVMRLVRFTLYFDPETMTVGQMVRDEMPSGLSPPLTDR